mgnify:CR=1 FL=1
MLPTTNLGMSPGAPLRSQVHVRFGTAEAAGLLRTLAQRFPNASVLEISALDNKALGTVEDELGDALATLPDGCWPAVTRFGPTRGGSACALPPRAAAHLVHLSPRLQSARVGNWDDGGTPAAVGDALRGALESLAAAHSTLEELGLNLSCRCLTPDAAQHAAAALARLRALLKLDVY